MKQALRALHIISGDLWAGAEVQVFTLMSQLAQMPDVAVAAMLMNEGILARRLRAIGIPVWVVDEKRTSSVRIFTGLRAVLESWLPDLIHTHREKENILGCLANLSCRNVASIRTIHGGREHGGVPDWRSARHRLVNRIDRWCSRTLQQRVIAVSGDLRERLACELPPEKLVVIENGVDVEAVKMERGVAEFRSSEPDCVHIGIAGRLAKVKRVDLFIEAAALLLREQAPTGWRFHVFGEGPLRGTLIGLSDALGVSDRIKFHGHRPDIATCIGGLDVLVISSDHEGMPMAALEAAALEVPTVAHAVGGLVEVITEDLLVRHHNAQGYRDGILRALSPSGKALAQGRASEVARRFSAERNADKIRSLYDQVVTEWNGN